jgi:integrase
MVFITDREKLKSGLIIFRRGDVTHRNFYCRIKLTKEDRYKTIALGTADRQTAHDQAFDLDADIRFRIKQDVPVFNRPFRQVAREYIAVENRRAATFNFCRILEGQCDLDIALSDFVASKTQH